jgi:hypothetical protein
MINSIISKRHRNILLDADGIFSFKKIIPSATKCIELINVTSKALTDIGWDANGDVDETAIASHCGGNVGEIKGWYDQVTGSKLYNNTLSQLPKIYDGSSLYNILGHPAAYFDVDRLNQGAFSYMNDNDLTVYTVSTPDTIDLIRIIAGEATVNSQPQNNSYWCGIHSSASTGRSLSFLRDGADSDKYRAVAPGYSTSHDNIGGIRIETNIGVAAIGNNGLGSSSSITGNSINSGVQFAIGDMSGGTSPFIGHIKAVFVFKKSHTQPEVIQTINTIKSLLKLTFA